MKRSAQLYSKLIKPYRVSKGRGFKLRDFDPADTASLEMSEKQQASFHDKALGRITELEQQLIADASWAVLLIVQGMDAAGKDSLIDHVMSGVNPQTCQVHSFKEPSAEDLSHDYLWRASKVLPERGHIGIFNRSYYEEVLVPRVHPEALQKERLPAGLIDRRIWTKRLEDIAGFERYLARNGIMVRKLFLDVSKEEQKKRFLKRLDDPNKNWKFSESDVTERQLWTRYMQAYQDAIRGTASKHAPWYVIPADNKWFTRVIATSIVVETLESLDLKQPKAPPSKQSELQAARKRLLAEAGK